MLFLAPKGEKQHTEEIKYHAAVGYNRFCVSPMIDEEQYDNANQPAAKN
jgi:hypothetical protein